MSIDEQGKQWIERALIRLNELKLPASNLERVRAALTKVKTEQMDIVSEQGHVKRLESARSIATRMMNLHELEAVSDESNTDD